VRRWEIMSLYCSGCGDKLDENFKYCPNCVKNLKGNLFFCSGCGKKMQTTNVEPKSEIPPVENIIETKKVKQKKFKLPKLSFKNNKKFLPFLIILIIVIVVIAAAAVILLNYSPEETNIGGRSFTILITNDFSKNAECYLVTDNFRQGTFGNPGFTVNANDESTITINEDDLMFQRDSYPIKLFVTIDDTSREAIANSVTEAADFTIDNELGEIELFDVICDGYQ
jgi:hypothetical protein